MNTFESIANRRSVRYFLDRPVERELVVKVLDAARLAPSGHNNQPWHFAVIATPEKKREFLELAETGLENGERAAKLTAYTDYNITGVKNTLRAMREAPVNILVLQTDGYGPDFLEDDIFRKTKVMTSHQSIGAAIENLALAACDLGLGTLWIGHTHTVSDEICRWLETDKILAAAVSLGYPAKSSDPRPRKSLDEIVSWL